MLDPKPQGSPQTGEGGNDAADIASSAPRQPMTLVELRRGSCRWPVGHDDDGAQTFCAEPISAKSSYCPEHHVQAHARQALAPIVEAVDVRAMSLARARYAARSRTQPSLAPIGRDEA
jgi:hypothetical protein